MYMYTSLIAFNVFCGGQALMCPSHVHFCTDVVDIFAHLVMCKLLFLI